MNTLKEKLIGILLFFLALIYFFGCAHQQPMDSKDADVEIWELQLSGQTKGKLEMAMTRVEIGKDAYSITGKISGKIDDYRGGLGNAHYNFRGKIENNIFSIHLGGRSEMAEGPSSILGKMQGNVKTFQGAGHWKVSHAMGSSNGKFTMIKIR